MKSSLPLIILNAKHPGIHDCQKCLRAERCPQGVKICQKQNEDPNLDTFILKIGQKLYSNTSNSIELELKTPKLANQNAPKETKESQVVEKDLEVEQGFSKADTKKEITPKGKKSVKNVAKKKK